MYLCGTRKKARRMGISAGPVRGGCPGIIPTYAHGPPPAFRTHGRRNFSRQVCALRRLLHKSRSITVISGRKAPRGGRTGRSDWDRGFCVCCCSRRGEGDIFLLHQGGHWRHRSWPSFSAYEKPQKQEIRRQRQLHDRRTISERMIPHKTELQRRSRGYSGEKRSLVWLLEVCVHGPYYRGKYSIDNDQLKIPMIYTLLDMC